MITNRIRGFPAGLSLISVLDEDALSEIDLSGAGAMQATARVLLKCGAVPIAWVHVKDRIRMGQDAKIMLDGAVFYPTLAGEKGAVRLLCTLNIDVVLPCFVGSLGYKRAVHFKYQNVRMTLAAAYEIISQINQLSEDPACLINTTPLWNSALPSNPARKFSSKYADESVPISTADAEYIMEIKSGDTDLSARTMYFAILPRTSRFSRKGDRLSGIFSDRILRGVDPLTHATGFGENGQDGSFEVYFSTNSVQVSSPTKRQKIAADEDSPGSECRPQADASPGPSGPRVSEPTKPTTAAQQLLVDIATAASSTGVVALDASERIWEVIRVISGAADVDAAIEDVSSGKGTVSVAPAIKSAIRPRVTQYLERVQDAIRAAEKSRIAAEEQLRAL
jgi:hypothetical protein